MAELGKRARTEQIMGDVEMEQAAAQAAGPGGAPPIQIPVGIQNALNKVTAAANQL